MLFSQSLDLRSSSSQLSLKSCNNSLKFFTLLGAYLFAGFEGFLESGALVLALFLVFGHGRLQVGHLVGQILDLVVFGNLRGNAIVLAYLKFLDLCIFVSNDLVLLSDLGFELLSLVT